MSSPFGDRVELTATARVNGEEVRAWLSVEAEAWNDPGIAEHAIRTVRLKLLEEIIKKAPPKIDVRMVSDPNPPGIL